MVEALRLVRKMQWLLVQGIVAARGRLIRALVGRLVQATLVLRVAAHTHLAILQVVQALQQQTLNRLVMQELRVLQEDAAARKEASVQSSCASSEMLAQALTNTLGCLEVELPVISKATP